MPFDLPENVTIRVSNISKEYRRVITGRQHHSLRDEIVRSLTTLPWKRKHLYERFSSLSDISFEVRRGERLGIIGPNGAGKSTLLKILCRITAPSSGSVAMRGKVTSILEVGTGFHPELSGRENVYLNGAILGMTLSEINARFGEVLAFADINQFIDDPVKHYSSGMYVRLAFSVAAHLDPDIMIVDEVLAVGDVQFRQKCMTRMRDITSDAKRTIVLVSHDLEAVQEVCSRCLLIQDSRLVFDGEPAEAIRRYRAVSS